METQTLKKCPLCGAKINGENGEDELLSEVARLKEQGILQHTMFIAIKIFETMKDNNPAWMRELLTQQSEKLSDSIEKELSPILKGIYELKGSPQTIGRMQEEAIAKRLSSLKIGQDRFNTEKSRKSQEDIECLVFEDGTEIGKIVIESKRTKDWQDSYIDQIRKYMERENTEFGILATTVLPNDALNNTMWKANVLVVNVDHIEPAYIFLREYLKLSRNLQQEFAGKIKQLEVRDQILEELKNAITSGELDSIIDEINSKTLNIENTVAKTENYLSQMFRQLRKDTFKIRELTSKLISEHIEKIRTQLIQQPPPFLLQTSK